SPTQTANSASGIYEKDLTTELTAEEMEVGEVNLRPSVGSRVGASLGELEACVEVSLMPTPPKNDAADARLSPDEIPIYDGIAVHTVWTRLQTGIEYVRKNYKPILGLTILVIASVISVGVVLGGKRNKSSAPVGNQSSMPSNTPGLPPTLLNGPNVSLSRGLCNGQVKNTNIKPLPSRKPTLRPSGSAYGFKSSAPIGNQPSMTLNTRPGQPLIPNRDAQSEPPSVSSGPNYLVGALAAPVVVGQTFLARSQDPTDGSAPCK
ncbi:hypothetical protein THAOC_18999, partial [Thalassiosira oceanica]